MLCVCVCVFPCVCVSVCVVQGGHFDLADRMFHSVREGWLSASKHNMADVKELIPEFFYLPEFMLNSNNFDLGGLQVPTRNTRTALCKRMCLFL